ncbi:MAG: hypothetical protein HY228_00085 [Candidatus Yonathbacteria bacterium]|nr:hypothetical protein [Candidatus Yonathbacteria bacterium]
MITKILDLDNIERKLFWILSGCLGIVLTIYLYSAFSLMGSVVSRDQISSSFREVSVTGGALEQEYITLKNSITLARAQELGFEEFPVKFSSVTSRDDSSGKLLSVRQ